MCEAYGRSCACAVDRSSYRLDLVRRKLVRGDRAELTALTGKPERVRRGADAVGEVIDHGERIPMRR